MSARDELRAQQNGSRATPEDAKTPFGPHGPLDQALFLPPPTDPMAVGRAFVAERYQHNNGRSSGPCGPESDDGLTLRHWRGQWWAWQTSHWAEVELREVRAAIYGFTEHAKYLAWDAKRGAEVEKDWAPNRHKVANVLEALAGIVLLPQHVDQPAWINGHNGHEGVIVACRNGLLDVASGRLLPHTPCFFSQTAVPFDYEPDAPVPARWLRFLGDLWGGEPEQIAALQEWFGYVLSGRLDLHKIFLLVGPTRAGKGVIARVLAALIGRANVAGPTLGSLQGDFGLAPLIGKPLAIIADARLNGRDSSTVVERLLSISGEDLLTVNVKYREQWSGKLPSRFLVLSNELPRLGDASAAIAGRFVTLLLERSWLGKEDPTLEPELHRELTGILNWSLKGLARLVKEGHFSRPQSTEIAFTALQDLASPVGAFIRDCCWLKDDDGEVPEIAVDDLWQAWRAWAEDNGHGKGGTKQVFGRDLKAVAPRIRRTRPRGENGEERPYHYQGIRLRTADDHEESESAAPASADTKLTPAEELLIERLKADFDAVEIPIEVAA